MRPLQPTHVGFLLAAVLGGCAYLYFVFTPQSELNVLWLLSGSGVRYQDGSSIRRNSLMLRTWAMQCISVPVFALFIATFAHLLDASRVSRALAQYATLLWIMHLAAYASVAAFHVLPTLLVFSFALLAFQLVAAYRLRVFVVIALSDSQTVTHRYALAALDMLMAWITYLLMVVGTVFALSTQGIVVHGEPNGSASGNSDIVVPSNGVLYAESTVSVALFGFGCYVAVVWLFMNGSAAHIINCVLCVALLPNMEVPSLSLVALIIGLCLVIPTTLNNLQQQYIMAYVQKAPPATWLESYNRGMFADAGPVPGDNTLPMHRDPAPSAAQPSSIAPRTHVSGNTTFHPTTGASYNTQGPPPVVWMPMSEAHARQASQIAEAHQQHIAGRLLPDFGDARPVFYIVK